MSSKYDDITAEELLNDLAETRADIKLCQKAIFQGVHSYGAYQEHSVQKRLDGNREIERAIVEELAARGSAQP